MKLKIRKRTSPKQVSRLTRKIRIRKTIKGTAERPRLCVYRSGKHIYAQVINDVLGRTLMSASSKELAEKKTGRDQAEAVGKEIAKKALAQNISRMVFDRNGFIYHGRVKALADGARAGGLNL